VQGDTAPERNNSTCRRSETPRRDEREMEERGTRYRWLPPFGPLPSALGTAADCAEVEVRMLRLSPGCRRAGADGNRNEDAPPTGPAGSAVGTTAPRNPGDAVFASGHSASVRRHRSHLVRIVDEASTK
jgi:hypothetical protein